MIKEPTYRIVSYETRSSLIHGRGRFALENINKGEHIHFAKIRKDTGFNHSCAPNVMKINDDIFVTTRDIDVGEEFTLNYASDWIIRGVMQCNCNKCRA